MLWLLAPAWAQPAWVLIHGGNGVTARNIPADLCQKLSEVAASRQPIRSIFLTHAGGWGLIWGRNSWATHLPTDMVDLNTALQLARQQNQNIRLVTVTPDSNGWAILLDDRQIVAQRCPSQFVDFFTSSPMYHNVECLAMGAGGSYSMTFDRSGFNTWASPTFRDQLNALNQQNRYLRFLWMAPGQEGVIYEDNGYYCTGVSPELNDQLTNLNRNHQRIECVAVRMDGSGNAQLALAPNMDAAAPLPPPVAATPTAQPASLSLGGISVESPGGLPAGAQLESLQPPAPANSNTRIVSEAYFLRSQKLHFDTPLKFKLKFDPGKVPAGHKVYPVLGNGRLLERLQPDQLDLQTGTLEFSLNHLDPRVHGDGSAPNKSFLAVATDIENLTPVLTRPDCTIYGAGATLEKARQSAAAVADTYSQIYKKYTALGFPLPARLDIYLLPLSGVRGEADAGHLTLDVKLWDGADGMKGTLAHETFHVCQGNASAGFETDQRTQSEANWAAEATAHYMCYRVFPNSPNMRLWTQGLRPEYALNDLFTYVPNSEGENPGVPAHQYQSFIFFAYLDKVSSATEIIKSMYRNPAAPPKARAASLPQLLNTELKARSGRGLADVYVDFLVHYLWRKDFAPLANDLDVAGMGKPGAIKQPVSQVAQNLPYDGNGRELTKSFRATSRGFGMVQAYNISSMTSAKRGEKGKLTVRARGPEGVRIVVFPYKNGPQAPLFGATGKPVAVPKWEDLGGALVWLIHTGEDQGIPVGLDLSMAQGGKPYWARISAKVNPGNQSLTQDGRTVQLGSGQATVQDGVRTLQFTWTQPPERLEVGQRFPMKLTIRRTAGDGDFPFWRLGLESSGLISSIKSMQPNGSHLYALLPGGPPEQSTAIESNGEYVVEGKGYKIGDSFELGVRCSNPKLFLSGWYAQQWTYRLTRD